VLPAWCLLACVPSASKDKQRTSLGDAEGESLYEAAIKAVARFREDPWIEQVATSTSQSHFRPPRNVVSLGQENRRNETDSYLNFDSPCIHSLLFSPSASSVTGTRVLAASDEEAS
jgi:hypothetical protein